LVKKLEDYPWSSHQAYLSRGSQWKWLNKGAVGEMFAGNPRERVEAYRKFVGREDSREMRQLFSRKRWPAFLGSEKFMAGVKGRFSAKTVDSEVPQGKELAPDLDRVLAVVSRGFGVKERDLFYSRRGKEKEARNMAIYLSRMLRGDRLKAIGTAFKIGRYSTVSSIVERMKDRIGKDELLQKRVKDLISSINMSHEKTPYPGHHG
jgi:putative transposase